MKSSSVHYFSVPEMWVKENEVQVILPGVT